MRDIVKQEFDQFYTDVVPSINYNYSYSSKHISTHRYRGDKHNGLMVGGFRYPTAYEALDYRSTSHPFSYTYKVGSYTVTRSGKVGNYHISGAGGPNYGLGGTFGTRLFPSVSTRLRNESDTLTRLACLAGDFSAGAFLGELRQTASHLAVSTITFFESLIMILKGDLRGALKTLGSAKRWTKTTVRHYDYRRKWNRPYQHPEDKVLNKWRDQKPGSLKVKDRKFKAKEWQDFWLEYHYAWVTLASDIYAMLDALEIRWKERPPIMSAKTVREEYSTYPSSRFQGQVRHGIEQKYMFTLDDDSLNWYMLSSLGLINPVSVAWELTTLSFVVDWFVPIGNFLEALTATVGLDWVAGYRTEFAEGDYTVTNPANWSGLVSGAYPRIDVDYRAHTRVPLTGFPYPKPYYKVRLNTNQTVTALALVRQFTKG